jgi:hypothetical protein
LTEIRDEVKKMIQSEMGTILESCKSLITESLATYQTQTQDTIKVAIQSAFTGPAFQAQQYARQPGQQAPPARPQQASQLYGNGQQYHANTHTMQTPPYGYDLNNGQHYGNDDQQM